MATAAPSANQATDLLQKLSIDSQAKSLEIPEPTKKPSANQYVPVDSANVVNGHIPSSDRSMTPLLTDFADQPICYLPNGYAPYYYGGYECSGNEWDDYPRFVNPDGVEMTSGVYGDNGSLMYPHGYGFAPYSPYSPAASPVPTMGNDGQLYGPQHYQYPPYFQPMTPTSAPYTPSLTATQSKISTTVGNDQKSLPVDTTNGNSNSIVNGGAVKGSNGSAPFKSTHQHSSVNSYGSYARASLPGRVPTPGYQDPRLIGYDGVRSPISWLDVPLFSDGQPRPVTSTTITSISNSNNVLSSRNQNHRPNSQFMGLHQPRPMSGMSTAHGFLNKMYPSKVYDQYGNSIRSGMGFGYHGYDSQTSGRAWLSVDNKYKPRGRSNGNYAYGNENMDGLNELNKGPRAKSTKNQKGFAPTITANGQNLQLNSTNDEVDKANVTPNLEQYNNENFPENYTEAKIFIIKSYSEDDVHKSIKYNVWASTPNGNKKLNAAYQEAQEKSGGCPVFLFFSVNTSGQFVGLAEMVGPVDFNESVEYWQQDKWNGCFPVKWHIVKDVPNSLLKHITLENNENKAVTNSRDTQEVKLEPGLKMIKIFKEYSSKSCILDDFGFYEARQKTIQEKKARLQFQKQVLEGKPVEAKRDVENGKLNPKSLDDDSEPVKDSIPTVPAAENVKVAESVSVPTTVEAPKGAKPVVTEKRIVANGAANGY